MFMKVLLVVLLMCVLFLGQFMVGYKGHEFVWVKNVDYQLCYEVDSDELCVVVEELVEGLCEYFYW